MSYLTDNPVGGTIQARTRAKKLRTELVKIGEEILQDLEQHKVPNDEVIKRFKSLVDEARSAGIYES